MEEKKQNEINLIDLIFIFFGWIRKTSLKIGNFIGRIIRMGYRHKVLVSILVLVTVAIGQYLSRPSARVYSAEGTALLYGNDAQTVRQIFRQLENSLSKEETISLSTKLGINDSVAKNILKLESFYLIDYMNDSVADKVDYSDSHSLTDTTNVRMRDRIYIRMYTQSIQQVPVVEKAILDFLNNHKLLKARYEAKVREYEQKVAICDNELQRLDSLAKTYYFKQDRMQFSMNPDQQLLLGEQRKQLLYGDLFLVQRVKSNAEFELTNMSAPVEIPSSLVIIPNPLNSRLKYGAYSILVGLLLGLALAGLIEGMKQIVAFLNSK
jgi:hypothetical protein